MVSMKSRTTVVVCIELHMMSSQRRKDKKCSTTMLGNEAIESIGAIYVKHLREVSRYLFIASV